MPWVRDMLIGIFNDENKIFVSERPALDISLGATYYAAMKMGLLSHPDIASEKLIVEFEVTAPHDIGFLVVNNGRSSFFNMIRRGTPYPLAKKSQVFTLSGENPEDMTKFELRILERIDKEHKADDCKLIGDVEVSGLPERPSGKTRLKITLAAQEEGGLVTGTVEDMGFGDEYPPSGFKAEFSPDRGSKSVMNSDMKL
jgi:molecular chaperone DnaK (HSP70)